MLLHWVWVKHAIFRIRMSKVSNKRENGEKERKKGGPSILWSSFFTFCLQPSQWMFTLRTQVCKNEKNKNIKILKEKTKKTNFAVLIGERGGC
jgi:hypothetical protein